MQREKSEFELNSLVKDMPEDKHYSKFESMITCRNTSYYRFFLE